MRDAILLAFQPYLSEIVALVAAILALAVLGLLQAVLRGVSAWAKSQGVDLQGKRAQLLSAAFQRAAVYALRNRSGSTDHSKLAQEVMEYMRDTMGETLDKQNVDDTALFQRARAEIEQEIIRQREGFAPASGRA